MANTITGRKADYTRRRKTARLTVALTAASAYVQVGATTGEILDLANILNPSSEPNIAFGGIPVIGDFTVTKTSGGYTAEVVALTPAVPTLSNSFALKIYSAPGTELAAAAYPAALTAGLFYLEVNTNTWGQA